AAITSSVSPSNGSGMTAPLPLNAGSVRDPLRVEPRPVVRDDASVMPPRLADCPRKGPGVAQVVGARVDVPRTPPGGVRREHSHQRASAADRPFHFASPLRVDAGRSAKPSRLSQAALKAWTPDVYGCVVAQRRV